MKIVDQKNLSEAVEALQNGQIIVFPTETSYGLGCDATNQEAVDKIFEIKQRKSDKPLLVVVPNVEMAKKYLVWNELIERLANAHWPGPLTIVGEYLSLRATAKQSHNTGSADNGIATSPRKGVVPRNDNLAVGVVSADNTIAVRVTNFPLTKLLSEKLNRPLVATSANLADAGDVYDSKKITIKSDILIDGGELPQNPPTTIVSVVDNNLKILRQGQIKIN